MQENEITRFDPQLVSIDPQQVLRLVGYPQGAPVATAVTEALAPAIRAALDLAEPKALHNLQEVQWTNGEAIRLSSGATFHGQRLAHALRGARQAALFVLTLGPQVSSASREAASSDPLHSFLLDSVASILVETVADHFQARLERHMNQQRAWGGLRYSPGYCDWPIQENRALLQLLDAQRIGVQLTTGGMMAPQKTISGLVGFAADPESVKVNPCIGCPRTTCDHRRDQDREA